MCTRNRPAELERCLAALARLNYPSYEIIVVDNAPSDARAREVALRWGVRYLLEPVRGASRARNRGAFASKGEIVAYLDDDAVADPNWLKVLAQEFADPRVMTVTGAILPIISRDSLNPASGANRGPRRIADRDTPHWFEIANFGALGDESNMSFRRSIFGEWPGLDERLGRGNVLDGGEGHYAFFSLIDRGYRIVYNPEAIVRHPDPDKPEEIRRQHFDILATAAAYITYLAVEHPAYWGTLAHYLWNRLRATGTTSKEQTQNTAYRRVPRWLTTLTVLSGPWIYLRSRISRTASPRVDDQDADHHAGDAHPVPTFGTARRKTSL